MEKFLRQFNGDKSTKEAVLNYMVGFFEEEILARAMKKVNTDSMADAITELKKGFDQLDIDYGIKKAAVKPTNQAR